MPAPRAANTSSATAGGWVMAKPRAVPMRGAVQGLATTTASTPVKKLPLIPPRFASPLPVFMMLPPNSTRPDRDRPMARNR